MRGVCEWQLAAIWWDWGLNTKLKRMPLKSLSKWCDPIYSLIYHSNFYLSVYPTSNLSFIQVQYELGSIRAEVLRIAAEIIDCLFSGNS